MIELFITIMWISIGLGVFSVFNARHGDKREPPSGFVIFAAILWPAFVVAEIYRHVTREKGGEA